MMYHGNLIISFKSQSARLKTDSAPHGTAHIISN